ncbi:MAG TPA: NAD-dependent epimerase/dehydratase family protein, partial [Polyangiaceae bacterium]|nr:NAD-dependent epimerase/dehydratase family protein [Polyangiaceae bacterium]
MRILLTGAAGFIGSHLSRRFLAEGHEVVGVDNFLTGSRENVAPLLDNPRFRLIEHDAISPLQVDGKIDWVMHFACPASPPKYLAHPIATMRISAEGTFHLLELAEKKGAQFFLASTSEVYGDPNVHPQPESYWGHVNPIGERSVYDEGKRYAEAITAAFHRERKLPIRIIRIFNTYGPMMQAEDGRVVTNFVVRGLRGESLVLYGDGSQTRSFQYVDDLVECIFRLMGVSYFGPV